MTKVKYELSFKTTEFPWKVFDIYSDKSDPELIKYAKLMRKTKFNDGVKLVEIRTIRTSMDIDQILAERDK